MTGDPCVLDVALAQLEEMQAPTVIIPVVGDGQPGTIYATYQGDEEYMAFALDPGNQADVAIACCKRAYAEALKRSGGRMQARGPERQRPT
jgi:hypothetical protein